MESNEIEKDNKKKNDYMNCPICNEKINIWDKECSNCKTNFEEYEKFLNKSWADSLNMMANINIVLTIIGTIALFFYFDIIYAIIIGLGVLLSGYTIFCLLKVVVDIYKKVEK